MAPDQRSTPDSTNNVSIEGNVVDSVVIAGDNNTVNQTLIQKFFNIFKSDAETLEQRNRRILLNHVENAWIKGVLDASLHGAAMLELGIKADPDAVKTYPWAIKKESTDETIPAGTPMLEIFDSIGMGRSMLILGAPGSGKTTMLLELARQLIAHAREDVTYPIPMVFNLASWTEKLTLADWLAQELNNLYSVPRKTAPDWVKRDKLLLLLDGLDEVRQESRAKCVEAINAFRKEHGLTSLVVCSRNQDYAHVNAKLSFEGAIEIQPLSQEQITEFFNRFGKDMMGIAQVLEKDSALREMAETPLFLSIMIMAYRDKRDVDIWKSKDENAQPKQLFDTYVEHMFDRAMNTANLPFSRQQTLHYLSWLARKMVQQNITTYQIEVMQPKWLEKESQGSLYRLIMGSIVTPLLVLGIGLGMLMPMLSAGILNLDGICGAMLLIFAVLSSLGKEITMVDRLNWTKVRDQFLDVSIIAVILGLIGGLIGGLTGGLIGGLMSGLKSGLISWLVTTLFSVFVIALISFISLIKGEITETTYSGQRLKRTLFNTVLVVVPFVLIFGLMGILAGELNKFIMRLSGEMTGKLIFGLRTGLISGLLGGFGVGLIAAIWKGGGGALIQHYALRFTLAWYELLPNRLTSFLDHCVDLIFLRRVGGGYIFVHRLLMEHFAEMYVDTPTSKGNQK